MQIIIPTPLQVCMIADELSRVLFCDDAQRTFRDIEVKFINGVVAYISVLVKSRYSYDEGDDWTPDYTALEDVDIEITEALIQDQDDRLNVLALSESQINHLVII